VRAVAGAGARCEAETELAEREVPAVRANAGRSGTGTSVMIKHPIKLMFREGPRRHAHEHGSIMS
jgi:hypothetical protein